MFGRRETERGSRGRILVGGGGTVAPIHSTLSNVQVALQSNLGLSSGSWLDQSGNGRDFTEATNPPSIVTSTLNGIAVLTFDGTNDRLANAAWSPGAPGSQAIWYAMLVRQVSWTNGDSLLANATGTGNAQRIIQNSVTPQIAQRNTTIANSNSAATIGSWFLIEVLFNNATTDYVNIGATKQTGTNAANTAATGRCLGACGTTDFSNIEVAGFWATNGEPTAGERTAFRAAVTSLYGGTVTTCST